MASESGAERRGGAAGGVPGRPVGGLARWQKLCFALGVALLLSGLMLHAWTALHPRARTVPVTQRAEHAGERAGPTLAEAPALDDVAGAGAGASTFLPSGSGLPSGVPDIFGRTPPGDEGPTGGEEPGAEEPDGGAEPTVSGTGDAPPEVREPAAAEQPAGQTAAEKAAPILTESGVMFFLGFCIGAAIRAVAKMVTVVVGLVMLAVLGLQYIGVIPPVDWGALGGFFQSVAVLVQEGASRMQDVLAHTLPSGTMAGLGVATGLKKS
jgi:uncharacterized membrane protein (Fun14 family)